MWQITNCLFPCHNNKATFPSTQTNITTGSTTTSSTLLVDDQHRCGTSELDARERCGPTCVHNEDCSTGTSCRIVAPNYCGSIPKRTYINPVQSSVWMRCGKTEIDARTFCGTEVSFICDRLWSHLSVNSICSHKWQCTPSEANCISPGEACWVSCCKVNHPSIFSDIASI